MPVLGAIGNASEYSFRGTYDNYPFDIDFGNLTSAEIQNVYYTSFKLIEDINYKVPISITGGEYSISNIVFDKVFGNRQILFADQSTLFGTNFTPEYYEFYNISSSSYWRSDESFVRNGNTVSLRIIAIPPITVQNTLSVVNRSSTQYDISLLGNLDLVLRDQSYTFDPQDSVTFQNRTAQGSEVGLEYYGKSYSTTVTIGKKQFTWSVTTKKANSPTNLSFSPLTDQTFATEVVSSPYTVSGLTDSFTYTAEITSSEGSLSVNNGTYVPSSIVKNGDNIKLKVTSPNLSNTTKTVSLKISVDGTIGAATTSWTVTTLDNIPSNLSFTDIASSELNLDVLSNSIVISGLSTMINFNVSVPSGNGSVSVNGGPYITSTTLKNGDIIQLKTTTTGNWLEKKSITAKLEDTQTTWNVTNRTIKPKSDSFASNLVFAYPLEINSATSQRYPIDVSSDIRGDTKRATTTTTNLNDYTVFPTEQSKFYLTSHKLKPGTSTVMSVQASLIDVSTDSTFALNQGDFTYEMWFRTDTYAINDNANAIGYYVLRPPYIDTPYRTSANYTPLIIIKGDKWTNTTAGNRGIWVGYVNTSTFAWTTITETGSVLTTNTWHHIAVVRSGNTFSIYVDGINRSSASVSIDFPGYNYGLIRTIGALLVNGNAYAQDVRLYKGLAKYATNFNPFTVNSIMERYNENLIYNVEFFVEIWGGKGEDWTVGPDQGGLSASSPSRLGGKGGYTKIKMIMPSNYILQLRPSYQGSTGGGGGGSPSGASAALLVSNNWLAVVGGGGGAGGSYIYSPPTSYSDAYFVTNNASPGGAGSGGYSATGEPSFGESGRSCNGVNPTSFWITGTVSGSGGGGASGGVSGGTSGCDPSGQNAGGPTAGGSGGSGNIRIYREKQSLGGSLNFDSNIYMEYVTHQNGISDGGRIKITHAQTGQSLEYTNSTDLNVFDIGPGIPIQGQGDFYVDSSGRILILSAATPGKDPRTLTKTTGKVLPGTDTCIDDARWQNFLTLARNTDGYRLTATLDNSSTRIITATDNNIRRMINSNYITLKTSLTNWELVPYNYPLYVLAWDETSYPNALGSGLDYSILSWGSTSYYYGYYGASSNPFFNSTSSYSNTTANFWILPPGVPDF